MATETFLYPLEEALRICVIDNETTSFRCDGKLYFLDNVESIGVVIRHSYTTDDLNRSRTKAALDTTMPSVLTLYHGGENG
jgi:hypothetical protein